jgi:hypothetical protein
MNHSPTGEQVCPMKKLNARLSKIIYLLFYGLICGNFLAPLLLFLYLPSAIIWRLEGIRMEIPFLDLIFVVQLTASILLWMISYLVIKSAKTPRQIFFSTLIIINLSYAYALLPVLTTGNILPILWIPELIFVFFSLILALIWQNVWQSEKIYCPWLLLLPFIACLILVVKESPGSEVGWIFRTYFDWGLKLKKLTGARMNLFFLDFTGFTVLLLNLINTLIVLPLTFAPKSTVK